MEKHKCKLCSRTFANGRALGGHMKGHLATLPLPPKTCEFSSSFSSSSSSEEEGDGDKSLRDNTEKTAKLGSAQDIESESESRKLTRKRSKRTRKSAFLQNLQQPMLKNQSLTRTKSQSPTVSSISDGSSDKDVAMCLIMLSRDKWITRKQENFNAERQEADEEDFNKFECEKCKKKFRSSKALSGHKATHKKIREEEVEEYGGDDDDKVKDKIFECPFCYKVFGSGQALGGHKRSHLLSHHANGNDSVAASCSSTVVNNSTVEVKMKVVLIDLNLPAPVEEDNDEYSVVSEVEVFY